MRSGGKKMAVYLCAFCKQETKIEKCTENPPIKDVAPPNFKIEMGSFVVVISILWYNNTEIKVFLRSRR